ncbi:MAG: Ig-like domain-containing protein, partial [Oscillospiraceae bacterium]|nr:Ig-like domain-containing protein [Oscillospiraceae bacterium]
NVYKLIITEGESYTLKLNGTVRPVTWRASNPSVAVTDASGNIKALTPGYSCIIAKVGNTEITCGVTVISTIERKISDLKSKYPEGYFYNSHTPDANFPFVSNIPCDHRNDRPLRCKGQCAGYAAMISNEAFGANAPRIKVPDVASVKAGDYVRYSNRPNHYHSVIVMRVIKEGDIVGYNLRSNEHIYADEGYWIVTDGNWGGVSQCGIFWDRVFYYEYQISVFHANESYSRF